RFLAHFLLKFLPRWLNSYGFLRVIFDLFLQLLFHFLLRCALPRNYLFLHSFHLFLLLVLSRFLIHHHSISRTPGAVLRLFLCLLPVAIDPVANGSLDLFRSDELAHFCVDLK
ncbi:hypothetical protein PFISCL1PPCAC_11701, partial [Pristionchus fissidentatus]